MSWLVPELSEKTFEINANTSESDDISDIESELETINQKLDDPFYEKTLDMINANVTNTLNEFLIQDRNLDETTTESESLKYYHVLVLPSLDGWSEGDDIQEILKQNKQSIQNKLETIHNAKNIHVAKHLSFVSAEIPVNEIRKLAEYENIKIVGDGELDLEVALGTSKQVIKSENIRLNSTILDGSGVVVSVIDSGVKHSLINSKIIKHVDINDDGCTVASQRLRSNDLTNCNTQSPSSTNNPHGTQVAGIILGDGKSNLNPSSGVATGTKLLNVKRADDPSLFQTSSLAKSLEWSLQNGADIINASFEIYGDGSGTRFTDYSCNSSVISSIVDEVIDEGILIVAAAGNYGHKNRLDKYYSTIPGPSCGYNVISVGNLEHGNLGNSDDKIYYGEYGNNIGTRENPEKAASSKGPTPAISNSVYTANRLKPEIVAPGTNIVTHSIPNNNFLSAQYNPNEYFTVTGTSFAAPHVTGAAALLLQARPEYSPLEIKSALMIGARWTNSAEINPILPLTANTYEAATRQAMSCSTTESSCVSTAYRDHQKLNDWGFGVLDVAKSIQYATSHNEMTDSHHIIRDSYPSCPSTPCSVDPNTSKRMYTFSAQQGDKVRIILSWLHHPSVNPFSLLNTANISETGISNFDLEVSGGGLSTPYTSNSTIQNNEFIIFEAPRTGTYTATVIPTQLNAGLGSSEEYVLAATKQLTRQNPPTNNPPVFTVFSPILLNHNNIPFTIALNTFDADGDPISFFVEQDPSHGVLSSIRRFDTFTVLDYMPTSNSATQDSFILGSWDGKDFGDSRTITINPGSAPTNSNIYDDSAQSSDQQFTVTFQTNGPETKTVPLPTGTTLTSLTDNPLYDLFFGGIEAHAQSSTAVTSIKVSVTAVNGAVLEYVIDSKSYLQFIPPESNKLITFDSAKILTSVKIHKHLSQGAASATIGYTFGPITPPPPPITNYPPTAIASASPSNTINELTTVTLDASASTDHEDTTLTYSWRIIRNSMIDPITLGSTSGSSITLRTPSYDDHPIKEFLIIKLTVTDSGGLYSTKSVILTVNSVAENENSPIARNDTFRVPSSGQTSLDVLENDHPNKTSLTISSIGLHGTSGTVSISSNSKSINYTPCSGCTGDSFTYTVSDGTTTSAAGLVTLRIGESFDVYATSKLTQEIQRFSESGTLIEKFVSTREGDISYPEYLAWVGDYLYVSPNSSKIYRYDIDGMPYGYAASTTDAQIENLRSGRINDLESNGTDLYASNTSGYVYKYDLSNNPVNIRYSKSTFASGISNPGGIAIDPSGNVYVVRNNQDILKFTSSGTMSVFASQNEGGMSKPYDVSWYDNHLYVSSAVEDEIYRFDSFGNPYGYEQNQQSALMTDDRDLDDPSGIYVSNEGTMYIANDDDDNILSGDIPTTDTELQLDVFATGLSDPIDVTLGHAQELNSAPSLDPLRNRTMSEGSSLVIAVRAMDSNQDTIQITATLPTFAILNDNEDGTATITINPGYLDSGQYTISVSASDGTDSDSKTFSLTVQDTPDITSPIITIPPNITIEATDFRTVVDIGTATATDDIDTSPVITNNAPASFLLGSTTVTWTATDSSQNVKTATQTITIQDTTPPVFDPIPDVSVQSSSAPSAVSFTTPRAQDIFNFTTSCNPQSGSLFNEGNTRVTCTATDASGNQSSATFSVIVNVVDTIPPVLTAPAGKTMEATARLTTVNIGAATATDNSGTSPTITNDAPSSYPLGQTTVTWTAADGSGNVATATQTITIQDTTAPVFDPTPDISITLAEVPGSVQFTTPDAQDIFNFTTSCNPQSGSLFNEGTTTVRCTATDASGNQSSTTFSVIVQLDNIDPVIIAPFNITREATGPQSIIDIGAATATDNGNTPPTITNDAPDAYPLGQTVVTWTATDDAGNTATAPQTITIQDTIAPTITIPGPSTLNIRQYTDPGATISDLVDGTTTITGTHTIVSFDPITLNVNYLATDSSGNESSATRTVIIQDTPTTTITIPNINDSTYARTKLVSFSPMPPSPYTSIACDLESGSLYYTGRGHVSCVASDPSGNIASTSFTLILDELRFSELKWAQVELVGDQNQLIRFTDGMTVPYNTPKFSVLFAGLDWVLVEICNQQIGRNGVSTGGGFAKAWRYDPIPDQTCPLTIKDNQGNMLFEAVMTIDANYDGNRIDVAPPIFVHHKPESTSYQDFYLVNQDATFSRARDNLTLVYNTSTTSLQGISAIDSTDGDLTSKIAVTPSLDNKTGTHEATFTVTDSAGNTASMTRMVLVQNDPPPIIILEGGSHIKLDINDTYTDLGAHVHDNTDPTRTITGTPPTINTSVPGTHTITYTATDTLGNTSFKTRTVQVVDPTHPFIEMFGDNPLYIQTGSTYKDPRILVTDDLDETRVVDAPLVDTSQVADFVSTYTVTDTSGNTATAQRTIHVVDELPKSAEVWFVDNKDGLRQIAFRDGMTISTSSPAFYGGTVNIDSLEVRLCGVQIGDTAINTTNNRFYKDSSNIAPGVCTLDLIHDGTLLTQYTVIIDPNYAKTAPTLPSRVIFSDDFQDGISSNWEFIREWSLASHSYDDRGPVRDPSASNNSLFALQPACETICIASSIDIDLTSYDNEYLAFWLRLHTYLEDQTILELQFWDGNSWILVESWGAKTDPPSGDERRVWIHVRHSLEPYTDMDDFKFRLVGFAKGDTVRTDEFKIHVDPSST